jgi:hypothetical protein
MHITYVWSWRETLYFSSLLPPNYFLPFSSAVFFSSFSSSSNLFAQWQSHVVDNWRIVVLFRRLKGFLSSTDRSDRFWVSPSYPCILYWWLLVRRASDEPDHVPLSSGLVKNAWKFTPTSLYAFMLRCIIRHRDAYIFIYLLSLPPLFHLLIFSLISYYVLTSCLQILATLNFDLFFV